MPLTAEGTIVVDGVLASCYASFDHDWAHALTAPIRWFPALFEAAEDRDADGPRGEGSWRIRETECWGHRYILKHSQHMQNPCKNVFPPPVGCAENLLKTVFYI